MNIQERIENDLFGRAWSYGFLENGRVLLSQKLLFTS